MEQSIEKKGRLPIFRERLNKLLGDMSITEFAEKVGISRQAMGFYLNGDRIPDSFTLAQICKACSVSSDWLIGLSNDPAPKPCAVDELRLSHHAIESLQTYSQKARFGLSRLLEHDLFKIVCFDVAKYVNLPDSWKSEKLVDIGDHIDNYRQFEKREDKIKEFIMSSNPDIEDVKILIGYNYCDFLRSKISKDIDFLMTSIDITGFNKKEKR